jgi:hypothetical protein
VTNGDRFVVCDSPPCGANELTLDELNDTLADATGLCLPNLQQCSSTGNGELMAWINSDPGAPANCVGIKRIPGATWNSGVFYLNLPATGAEYNPTLRRVARDGTNSAISTMYNYAEYSVVAPGNVYGLGIAQGIEKPIGPSRFPAFYNPPYLAARLSNLLDPGSWPSIAVPQAADFSHGVHYSQLDSMTYIHGDYYAMIRLEVAIQAAAASAVACVISANGQEKGRLYANENVNNVSISFPVLISRSNHTMVLNLSVTGTGALAKYNYSIYVDGVFL